MTRNRWKLEIIDEELRRGSGCNRVGRIARKIEETGCQERIAGVVRKESERPFFPNAPPPLLQALPFYDPLKKFSKIKVLGQSHIIG